MQSHESIALIGRLEDPETSQIIADDDGDIPNEDSGDPRLARKSLFEPGVRWEGVRSREDRKMCTTQHGFYNMETQTQLQPGSGRDRDEDGEQSYFCEDALDVKTKTGYMNAAASRDGEWTGKSGDACIARDEEWKEESPESWIQLPMLDTNVVDDDDVSAAMDESSGKACPSKQAPTGLNPFSRMSTYDELGRSTFHSSSNISSFFFPYNKSKPKPNTPSLSPRTPLRNLHFSDPGPDRAARDSTILSAATLDALLDACIEKTRILLAVGREALRSTAEAGFEGQMLCASDDDDDDDDDVDETGVGDVKGGDEEERSHSHNSAIGTANALATTLDWKEGEKEVREAERKEHCNITEREKTATKFKKEIVRVENWYKIKGAGETWREIGGREDLMGLTVERGRDVDVDVDACQC